MTRSNCFTCQNRDRSEWCALDGEDLRLLNQAKTCNSYQSGQVIYYQGNPCLGIHCIEDGTVALRRSDRQGHSVITRLAHGGATLGYSAFFADGPYSATAEALSTSKVCFIDKSAVRALLDRNPTVGHQFLSTLAHGVDESDDEKLQSVSLPLRARIAHLLLVLRERFGQVEDSGALEFNLPLSRQDMGALLGARPESISRAIRELEADGIARFDKRTVVVPDLDGLLDEVERFSGQGGAEPLP